MTHQDKCKLIDHDSEITINRQALLLNISRSSLYYQPIVNQKDIRIMNAIDKIYTDYPFYGSRRICYELGKNYDLPIGREHVQRLMRLMGLEAIYPKKNQGLSSPDVYCKKYPYLLRNVIPNYPNHIWGTDITYVRMEKGFAYLVAILDWFSRYVISWQLSESLEIDFCIENLERALMDNKPLIHNSDQGSHFTSLQYSSLLQVRDVQISMDGRGRCMDNIFTERLWRSVKYENIYLKSYPDFQTARSGLNEYFKFYNNQRPHQSLQNKIPAEIYFKN